MSMNSKSIKRKISSVNSTMQITKAMELVSTAKLRKTRIALETAKPYFSAIYESVVEAISHDRTLSHPLLDQKENGKKLVLVITADRGLCGGYNINAIKTAERLIDKNTDDLITIGTKALDYFTNRGYNVIDSFVGISEEPSLENSYDIGAKVTEAFLTQEYKSVELVFTLFKSTIEQQVKVMDILPFKRPDESKITNVIYEPSQYEVLSHLIPTYVNNSVYAGLMESSASEQAARRLAMENATNNAQDMIEQLGFKYNQARQAAITQELSEIVGGAEALQ